jgi:hypothetical protein
MDRDLLNALQNIGDQLDILSQVLADKRETTSDVATVLLSGDFSEQLKSISVEIKSIKADTQEILKAQQTILSMSKEKEKEKFGVFDDSGKQENNLKKGAFVILGIAAAVLAVGTAFNLIGDVNVASVLSLTVAIGIIALSFERLSQSKLTINNVLLASGLMVAMSLGILISSYILTGVANVNNDKILTSIGIAGAFTLISLSIGKIVAGIKEVKPADIPIIALGMLFIFPAIAAGIALSSYVLQFVQPIGLAQLFSGILVAGMFVVLSYSIKNIMKGLDGIKPEQAFTASITIPLLFTALSWSIALSSIAISQIVPITSFAQFITALGIAILFVGLSYAVKPILSVSKDVQLKDSLTIPLLFTALSLAIMLSSKILKDTEIIEFTNILKIVAFGIGLAIVTASMALSVKFLSSIGLKNVAEGSAAIVIIAGAIWASSHLLSMGDYTNTPNFDWALGAGISLIVFGGLIAIYNKLLPTVTIGQILKGSAAIVIIAGAIALSSQLLSIGDYTNAPNIDWALGSSLALTAFGAGAALLGTFVFGPQALVFAAGLLAVVGVAGTIVAVSKILKEGDYNIPNMLDWAKATSLLYATFAPIMVILGGISLASGVLSVFGVNPWENAKNMMLSIADTIVEVSGKLSKGNYTGGPKKDWAEGIGIAIGAFSPVYEMMVRNKVASIFTSGDIGPEDFNKAINTVADGIISVAGKFGGTEFIMGPTKDWAEGVGTAIGAFSPVYDMMVKNNISEWFGGGDISPEQFNVAIKTVSLGIIEAAKIFAENTSPFEEGKYPSENWGKGVGGALAAFSPVYQALMEKSFWKSDKSVIDNMNYGISSIVKSIVKSANDFAGVKWDVYPKIEWVSNTTSVIDKYISLLNRLTKLKDVNFNIGSSVASRMVRFANILFKGKEAFNTTIQPDFVQNISKNVLDFDNLVRDIIKNRSNDDISFNIFQKDPVVEMANNMITLANGYDKLASSLTNLGASMKGLNVDSLRSLALLTNVMVNPNITVPSVEIQKELNQINSVSTPTTISNKNEQNSTSSMEEKLEAMVELLVGIRSNTISLDQVMQLISEERIKKHEID